MKKTVPLTLFFLIFSSLSLLITNKGKTSETEPVTIKEVAPFTYCCLHQKGPFTDIQSVIARMWQAMQSQAIFPMGPMIGIYYNAPDTVKPDELEWEVGFPISSQNRVLAPLEKKQWSYTPVASALHRGPYQETGSTFNKIFKWLKEHNYAPAGPVMERYLDQDPAQVKPAELRTEIWIPCKKMKE